MFMWTIYKLGLPATFIKMFITLISFKMIPKGALHTQKNCLGIHVQRQEANIDVFASQKSNNLMAHN